MPSPPAHERSSARPRSRRLAYLPSSRRASSDRRRRPDARRQVGLNQKDVQIIFSVSLNNSLQVAPNSWSIRRRVSYQLVVQMPTYKIRSMQQLWTQPVTSPESKNAQLLMNVAQFGRKKVPMIVSQYDVRPVFDVNADVQGRDLN